MNDFAPVINRIQDLVGAQTPDEALEKIRGLVEGYPASEPPSTSRHVLVETANCYISACYSSGRWYSLLGSINGVQRWWELPW